jgi:hypothetical protein
LILFSFLPHVLTQPISRAWETILQMFEHIEQACQAQTTLRAAKVTKIAEGAAKVLKYAGRILQNLVVKNDFTVF